MRRKDPLILGAGPAGCAAAISLAKCGTWPTLVDRDVEAGDALCGGFLSWKTAERLSQLGIDPAALGAARVDHLILFGSAKPLQLALPRPAWGLSRQTLDRALRRRAADLGCTVVVDIVRKLEGLQVTGQARQWEAESLFLATGKHDVRGASRPRTSNDPALGLRLRVDPSPGLARRLKGRIELHLFDGGYAGIVLQEGGSANICLAVRKSLLAEHGGDPAALLAAIAARHGHFALRLEPGWKQVRVDTIGAVPYGWSCGDTIAGLFKLGDQAAVIPSLAGEGIDIAIASGIAAAGHWLDGGPAAAQAYQRKFYASVQAPLRSAGLAWRLGENPALAGPALTLARVAPSMLHWLMDATRLA